MVNNVPIYSSSSIGQIVGYRDKFFNFAIDFKVLS